MLIRSDRLLKIGSNPHPALLPWLSHQSSLTDKLKIDSGDAQLEVLSQQWISPSWWDKFTLGLSCDAVMHRDIRMFSRQTACWYARTIIPNATYHANHSFFDRLKHESLGVIVFNEPRIKRNVLLNYVINDQCLEYYWLSALSNQNDQFWVRFSVFTIADTSSFYLVEILLPGLWASALSLNDVVCAKNLLGRIKNA
jgi:chorismate lyase